ncbi:unnamed protein product [Pylaiella littoralis]
MAAVTMKYPAISLHAIALLLLLLGALERSSSFVPALSPRRSLVLPSSTASSSSTTAVMVMSSAEGTSSRRKFLSVAAAAVAGLGVVAGGSLGSPAAAAADTLGDLDGGAPTSMGAIKITEGEPLSEEAARVQRKLAAQAKLNGKTSSGQMTYSESRAAEDEKQQRIKDERNDKAKRRAAMCENLGRGC